MAVRVLVLRRPLSTYPLLCAGQKWRVSKGMARSGNEYGPLTDLPDWSYLDGQQAPDGRRKTERLKRREDMAKRIVQLTKEVDEAQMKATLSDKDTESNTESNTNNYV